MNSALSFWKIVLLLILLSISSSGYAQTDPKTFFETGVADYKQGKYQEAVDQFTKLIALEPENARAYKNRGVAWMSLMKMDEAILDFNHALSINPNLSGLHSNLGAAWHYKGEYEKAIASYNSAIKENPKAYITYFNRAISFIALNRYGEANTDLGKTLELSPGFEPAESARREVSKKLPATDGTFYAIQIGAFLGAENAFEMKRGLKGKGIDAKIIIRPDSKKRTWYLVRCGERLTQEAARSLKAELKTGHGIDGVVRPEQSF